MKPRTTVEMMRPDGPLVSIEDAATGKPSGREISEQEGLIDMWLAEEGFIDEYWPGVSVGQVADFGGATWGRLDGNAMLDDELCRQIKKWRQRPLAADFPYVLFGGLTLRGKRDTQVMRLPVLVAIGVTQAGYREILAVSKGNTEDAASWAAFLGALRDRGLNSVQLFISDRHQGLIENLAAFYPEAFWQGSGLHFPQRVDIQAR
jgi:putative transposase